ncbi:MAG: FHA domain-containing protein [Clostridiales bacterium]|nr:FHA domain-containing protein [Clostridiales bacterium]
MRQALEVGYVRDLRSNYMVIEMNNAAEYAPFCIKMLKRQEIDGLLSLEERFIDNRQLLYYDITARQSIKNILEKSLLSVHDLRMLCSGIIFAIEMAYEYLLPEDDFLLSPDFIYQDITSGKAYLCLYPGYGVNVREQMGSLMEYLMNKVDYNDKEAVYLVYRLYAVSKEEGYTLAHMKEVMSEKADGFAQVKGKGMSADKAADTSAVAINRGSVPAGKTVIKRTAAQSVQEEDYTAGSNAVGSGHGKEYKIPVVLEKLEQEEERVCYSLTTYLIAGICLLAGIGILAAGFMGKFVYNSLGTRLDYSKLAALIIILGCIESYLMSKLFDKKRKITRMVKTREYIDPRMDYYNSSLRADVLSKAGAKNSILRKISDQLKLPKRNGERDVNKSEEWPVNQLSDNLHANKIPRGMRCPDRLSDEASLDIMPKQMLNEDFQPTELLTAEEPSANGVLADTEAEKKESMPVLKALDNINYKDIAITNYPFFIGKLKKNVDFHLESDIVSRYHAKITKEGDSFYLTDLNSTNGTYINDDLLQTYQKKEIKLGDIIAFANIKYQFLLQES